MSLITSAEQAVEKVFRDVEAGIADIDGAALAEARRLLADAKDAESRVAAVLDSYKAEIAAALLKYGPEAAAVIEAEFQKLLSVIQGLFHLG